MPLRAGFVCLLVLASACRDGTSERMSPSSPSVVTTTPLRAPTLPVAAGVSAVEFPPRNEPLQFRVALETKYRDGLGRAPASTFVDQEGAVVWTQEYLRYRVNGCSHPVAVQHVLSQIDGGGIAPVCASTSAAAFPPRNEPYDFMLQLESKYQNGLRRPAGTSAVDVEGNIVWTQEYLRFRTSGCRHDQSQQKVFDEIDGRFVAACGEQAGVSGTWDGTSSYFNAPFVMELTQIGTTLRGTYRDQHDTGSIDGEVAGGTDLTIRIWFGDTGIAADGRWDRAETIAGQLIYHTRYPMTMRRRPPP